LPGYVNAIDLPADIRRAISSAGGVAAEEVDENFRLRKFPSTYVVGEMLDWDAAHERLFIAGVFFIGFAAKAMAEGLRT
jgi:predicted flavoprotein YhiN